MYPPPNPQSPPGYPQQQQYFAPPPRKGSGAKVALIVVGVLGALCVVGMIVAPPPQDQSGNRAGASAVPTVVANAQPQANPVQASPPVVNAVPTPSVAAPQPSTPAPPAQASGESEADAVPVGATVNVGGLEATVISARFTRRVGRNMFLQHTAPEGSTLLVLRYRVRNSTNEPITVLSFADAVHSNGASYEPSPQCDMAVDALGAADRLNPGLPRVFEACFEVPPSGRGFVVKFNRAFTDRFAQTGL